MPAYDAEAILLRFDATPDDVIDPWGDTIDGIGGNLWFLPGPDFALYGDGTVIFRDDEAARENPQRVDRSFVAPPLSTARLTPNQAEAVLDHAWTDGGLALAKDEYATGAVDLFISATFKIDAGERRKHVKVNHLAVEPGADAEDRERLVALADYLRHLDRHLELDVQEWVPERYWGTLGQVNTSFTGDPSNTWPWPHIELGGWVGGRRGLLPSEVEAVGLGALPGGYCCHLMSGPGGNDPPYTGYGLSLKPILPEPIRTDAVAEVVTTDLVVRTAPGTDASTSEILRPTLSTPQLLYVLDGPRAVDGFDWYLVQPFSYDYLPHPPVPAGWLAAGGQDGEQWIASSELACPPPNDLDAVVYLNEVSRLVCFGNRTVTFEGTLQGCTLHDPVMGSPESLAHSECILLPDSYRPDVVPSPGGLQVWSDSAPGGIQDGQRVHVEGHFDDSVAQGCDGDFDVLACRAQFVATAIKAA